MDRSDGLKWYQSSPSVRRGFCSECGASIFFDVVELDRIHISAGTLDRPTRISSVGHIYVHSKSDYYEIPEDGLLRYAEDDDNPPLAG